MNTPEDIQLQCTEVDFFQLAKREPNPRMRIRFLALGHLKAGKSKQEVAEMFQIVLITLRRWVLRFIVQGIEGLKEQPGKGRKKKLSTEQEEEFRQQVEKLQTLRKGGRVRAQDIQTCLKRSSALIMPYQAFTTCWNDVGSRGFQHGRNTQNLIPLFRKTLKKIPRKSSRGIAKGYFFGKH